MKTTRMSETKKFIKKGQLAKREGWNKAAITKLLGEPDKIREREGDKGDVQLYRMTRVIEIEGSDKLSTFMAKQAKRQLKKKENKA